MYATESFTIQHRPDMGLLVARWQTETTEPTQHQAEYTLLLHHARQCQCVRWLLDVRRRPQPSTALAEWIVREWLPQVTAGLAPQRLRLAYLISPARAEAVRQDTALAAVTDSATRLGLPYDLAVFGDEGEATRWLLAG